MSWGYVGLASVTFIWCLRILFAAQNKATLLHVERASTSAELMYSTTALLETRDSDAKA